MDTPRTIAIAGLMLAPTARADAPDPVQDADEVRAVVAEMLADAETRSSLLQGGGAAGFDNGFFVESGDGAFRLDVHALMQFRYVADFRDDAGGEDDFDHDFQNRYTRLTFQGSVYDDWIFKIQSDFAPAGGVFTLRDAYVGAPIADRWTLRAGQFKAPLIREELVSAGHSLAVETSQLNQYFTASRTQGVALDYTGDTLRSAVAFTDGWRQANTDLGANPVGNSDASFTGRVEYLLSGDFSQFDDFTSPPGSARGIMLGAAGHYQTGPDDGGADADVFAYTADISYEADGWNAFGAFVGFDYDLEGGPSEHEYGFVLQGGAYLTDNLELFARYSHVFLEEGGAFVMPGGDDDQAAFTVGVNRYVHSHAAKLTVDAVFYLDGNQGNINGGFGNPALGDTQIGRAGDDDDGEFALRAQMQLMF